MTRLPEESDMTPGWPATWWGNGVWSSRVSGRSIVSMDTLETDCVGMLLEREGAMLLRNAHCVRFVYAVPRCTGRRHSSGCAKPLPSFIVTAFGPRGGGSHRYIPPHSALCCVSSLHIGDTRTWKWRSPTLGRNKPIARSPRPRPDPADGVYSSATPPTG